MAATPKDLRVEKKFEPSLKEKKRDTAYLLGRHSLTLSPPPPPLKSLCPYVSPSLRPGVPHPRPCSSEGSSRRRPRAGEL